MAELRHPPPPVVTIRGGPAPRPPQAAASSPLVLPLLLGLCAATVVGAAASGRQAEPSRRPPPVAAEVALVAGNVPVSMTGIMVVPVVLRDGGPGHSVTSARAYAEPVRTEPVVLPPRRVAPGQARRFVVLLAPDCRLLGLRGRSGFRASLRLQVTNGGASQSLVLDVGGAREVQTKVRGLCRR